MSAVYSLKIRNDGVSAKAISILRKFDPSLSIADIRGRIKDDDFVVYYDLLHFDVTEEMAGIDRISRFEGLIRDLEETGAAVEIYDGEEHVSRRFFENSMERLREIGIETEKAMDQEAEIIDEEQEIR